MISKQAIAAYCKEKMIPSYRAKQILHAIYKEGKRNFGEISVLPRELQKSFARGIPIFSFEVAREVASRRPSRSEAKPIMRPQGATLSGDTVKTLFKLHDGKLVEGVLMRFRDGRNSVCISSQVGCGLKCVFCATGTMGFTRNLTAEEIADQVLYFNHRLKRVDFQNGIGVSGGLGLVGPKPERTEGRGASPRHWRGELVGETVGVLQNKVNHVIFMGMGEPFLNYDEVMKSVKILNDPDCLGIAARHITVSTSGVIPGIEKLAQEKLQINLAISIHAPNQALREKLMPIAKAYKLDALMSAIKSYIQKTHRRVSYEYVMLKNINDSEDLARQLGKLIKGQRCHVNLIPYNETYLGFSNAGKSRIDRFREILESFDIPVTVRVSLGQDISAACGQLAIEK